MNNKGMTLLELLICLVILGILIPFMGKFMINMAVASNKAIQATKNLQAAQNQQQSQPAHTQVVFNSSNENSTLTPIMCFDANGKPNSCTDGKPCVFDPQNGWMQQNKSCAYGVLLVY